MKRKLENGAHGRETPAEIKAGRAQHARGLPDLPRVRADSERIEPFVDIATLFAEKCHHWAFPRHICQTSASPQQVSPPHKRAFGLGPEGADGDDDPQLQTARDRTAGAAGISALGFPARRDGGEVRHRHRRPRCGPPLPPCAPAWCPNPLSPRRGTDRAIGAVAACGGGAAGRISVSFELPSDRGVVTDRAMEAWYNQASLHE